MDGGDGWVGWDVDDDDDGKAYSMLYGMSVGKVWMIDDVYGNGM